MFALPEAPPQPWAGRRPGIRRGAVERHTVTGRTPGEEREVWTYLPPEGAARPGDGRPEPDPLPVLVLCDGGMWFGRLGFQDTLDALIADGALPPLAGLSPDAGDAATGQRDPGGRETCAAFLADELLPWARARWPLTADAGRTAVSGQGLGGTTALYVALTRPERFGRALVQSPSPGLLHDGGDRTPGEGDLPPDGGDRTSAPVVHLALGLHDGAPSVEHGEALVPAVRARGHRGVRTVHNGGRDHACWQGLLTDALVETFR